MGKKKRRNIVREDVRQPDVISPNLIEKIDLKILAVVAGLLIFAVYANALTGTFVWDDQTIVVRNEAVKSFANIPYIFKHEFAEMAKYHGNIYRPIQEMTYMVDFSLYGMQPFGFHLTNILLHIASSLLLLYIVWSISHSRCVAFLSALIFGVHPVNTEAVSYISGRSDPLFLFFLLVSFSLYIVHANSSGKVRSAFCIIGSFFFYSMALFSRETAIVFPLIVIAYETLNNKSWAKKLLNMVPFIAATALYVYIRLVFVERTSPGSVLVFMNMGDIFWTNIKIVGAYLAVLAFPFNLHMARTVKISGPDAYVLLSVIAIAALVLWVAKLKKDGKSILFWTAWFVIFLVPYLNIVKLNAAMAEHWLYGASIGIYVLVSLTIVRYIHSRMLFCVIASLLITYLSVITITRNFDWKDEPSIYLNTLKYTPAPKIYTNLGVYYETRKEYEKSLEAHSMAVQISPNIPLYHNNIGITYLKMGNYAQAAAHFKKSLQLNPDQERIKDILRKMQS